MHTTPKRPIAVWIVLVVLLISTVLGAFGTYEIYRILEHYGLGEFVWRRHEFWTGLANAVLCPIALLGIWFRRAFGRWLAVFLFCASGIEVVATSSLWSHNEDTVDLLIEILSTTFALAVLAIITAPLFISRRVLAYFGAESSEIDPERACTPPPPPTFDV